MATEFSFEYVFRAPSTAALVSAYFDPDHNAAQDKVALLENRTVIESEDTDAVRKVTWRVTSQRQLPLIARPFVDGGRLRFVEWMSWRRGDDHVEMSVTPEILGGRVQITGTYALEKIGDDKIRRIYKGAISAALTLVGGKIERGIRDAFTEQMPAMAAVTQTWLDRAK